MFISCGHLHFAKEQKFSTTINSNEASKTKESVSRKGRSSESSIEKEEKALPPRKKKQEQNKPSCVRTKSTKADPDIANLGKKWS